MGCCRLGNPDFHGNLKDWAQPNANNVIGDLASKHVDDALRVHVWIPTDALSAGLMPLKILDITKEGDPVNP